MASNFRSLPPLKRFSLHHQQQTQEMENSPSPPLPAKKRKGYSDSPPPIPNTSESCSLPAKKRVWALQPIFKTPEKPVLSIDLNVEYQQSPEKEPPTPPKQELMVNEGIPSPSEKEEEKEEEEDGVICGICKSTDGDPTDPIVFCDGCDLMVHATCYGDPLIKSIPEGDWFCATCHANGNKKGIQSCCLCPVKGGVMKATTDGRFAHVMCALLVPEVFFRDPEGKNEIDSSLVPRRRWEKICYVCKSSKGCAIECSDPKCSLAFHVSCGLSEELCIEYREGRTEKGGGIVIGFCKAHTELWKKEQKTGKFKIVAREEHKN